MSTSSELKDGIDQIREILVGSLQRDVDRRFSRLEAHLGSRMSELQQEARRRTEVIEAHLRKETEALSTRLDRELVEVKDSLRALTRDHRENNSAFEQRISRVEETIARAQQELRSQILDQAKSFLDELHHTREELSEILDRELGSLEPEPAEESRSREPTEAGASNPL